jgi:phosphate transport system substrate-binding protein
VKILMRAARLQRTAVVAAVAGLALSSVVINSAASASVKLPKSGVETPAGGTVTETGSTLLYPLFNLWAGGYNTKYPSVTIQTAGTGSGTGISEAETRTIDTGASDAYLSPSVVSANPNLRNIPLAISAQIVAYNVPGVLSHLKLSGKVLSAIYQGQITKWNASQIASLNPGVTLPATPIVTLHRSDHLPLEGRSLRLGRQDRIQHHGAVARRTGRAR